MVSNEVKSGTQNYRLKLSLRVSVPHKTQTTSKERTDYALVARENYFTINFFTIPF